ncbi:MAG TPA: glycosyltransferase family 39 protein [Myxococcota bacterium]|nr:glycosyltransferase family 39 protein [Myxococcota bacterium]
MRARLSVLGVVLAVWCLVVALVPLEGVPHVSDEVVYTLQARLIAAGLLAGPGAPAPIPYPFWTAAPDAVWGAFPPGWPALLALGEALGAPWLVNALLAGTLPYLVYLVARERFERNEAWIAALVMALSPGIWVLGASRMSHTSVLVALLVATAVVLRKRDPMWAWLGAGVAVAYLVLARPFDALLLGAPLLIAGLWRAPSHLARALVVLPSLGAVSLVALGNAALTLDAFTFATTAWFEASVDRPGCNSLGFGEAIGCAPTLGDYGHTLEKAARQALLSLERLDRLLLGIPGGSVLALVGLWLGRRKLWPLIPFLVLPVLGYALYWSPGAAYGARFYHPAYVLLPICVALPLARWLPRLAILPLALAGIGGGVLAYRDLDRSWWCSDGAVRDAVVEAGATEGLLIYSSQGQLERFWPTLRVGMVCTSGLDDAMALVDPSGAGLQLTMAQADSGSIEVMAQQFGGPVWLIEHDLVEGTATLTRVSR